MFGHVFLRLLYLLTFADIVWELCMQSSLASSQIIRLLKSLVKGHFDHGLAPSCAIRYAQDRSGNSTYLIQPYLTWIANSCRKWMKIDIYIYFILYINYLLKVVILAVLNDQRASHNILQWYFPHERWVRRCHPFITWMTTGPRIDQLARKNHGFLRQSLQSISVNWWWTPPWLLKHLPTFPIFLPCFLHVSKAECHQPRSQVTGEEPSPEEVKGLTEELHKRSTVPANVMQTIDTLPLAPGQKAWASRTFRCVLFFCFNTRLERIQWMKWRVVLGRNPLWRKHHI